MINRLLLSIAILLALTIGLQAQHSIARQWNEKVLDGIRFDFARPTVHARNLFHTSVAMYDAWAVFEPSADTYLLGKTVHGYQCNFQSVNLPEDTRAAQEEAMSFAVYRLLKHRFVNAPAAFIFFEELDEFMEELGYDINIVSTNYTCSAAALGNYIAQELINYGFQDGANEVNDYTNQFYKPINVPLTINQTGNTDITDLNRWQPLAFPEFIDQSGNPLGEATPDFLSPEWGQVSPFSLQASDATIFERDGFDYWVYHDPGPPVYINAANQSETDDYRWGHSLVAVWSSHLDPDDGTLWDISPGALGNISSYPTNATELRDFYNLEEGGDIGTGHALNPITNLPYEANIVKRADYARVLAEFWADGPDSETPPGHWFTILNTVNDHPELEKRFKGEGPVLDDLEWDVKAYFILGGAMHDVAISAWGIKGWYDYVRPVSAIRGMASRGQNVSADLPNYNAEGINLIPGFIELIEAGDSLAGDNGQNIGKIKLYGWRGPDYINNPAVDVAKVGWVLAEDWWPYQRPTFVTPPFAGYISGHSTFSRAAAEVLTALTGDPYFPGGIGEFFCRQNRFLVFEEGPSEDIILQWATYRDASDQCSLSRIWGGIHPPVDDIPGRLIGERIGLDAFAFAEPYFSTTSETAAASGFKVFPNPTDCGVLINFEHEGTLPVKVYLSNGQLIRQAELQFMANVAYLPLEGLESGLYFIVGGAIEDDNSFKEKVVVY